MRVLFETPPVRALSSAERLPDGSDWPGTAQLVITLYDPRDPNPIGASGYPTAKPLTHWRNHSAGRDGTVNLSPSIHGPGLGPVTLPQDIFRGLPDTALICIAWRFMADKR